MAMVTVSGILIGDLKSKQESKTDGKIYENHKLLIKQNIPQKNDCYYESIVQVKCPVEKIDEYIIQKDEYVEILANQSISNNFINYSVL